MSRKNIPLSSIDTDGPERSVLTTDQERRIAAIHRTFSEILPRSLEQSLQDFRKDMHPEREIVVWENMATTYKAHVSSCTTLMGRKALFASILTTGGPPS
jgi:hypothetical protein